MVERRRVFEPWCSEKHPNREPDPAFPPTISDRVLSFPSAWIEAAWKIPRSRPLTYAPQSASDVRHRASRPGPPARLQQCDARLIDQLLETRTKGSPCA